MICWRLASTRAQRISAWSDVSVCQACNLPDETKLLARRIPNCSNAQQQPYSERSIPAVVKTVGMSASKR
jgi:hypothetical protein